jgi:2-dehydro-3-deoxyphosphogluconate aldolase / (4S)-4-hydroxy-2-oxoglutarate aldolase
VVAVIERDGRFLFVRRAPDRPGAGYWCPVSGRIERGESQREALRREVREELGVVVEAREKLAELATPDGAYRLHYWSTTLVEGEPRIANDEATGLRWLTLEELRDLRPTYEDDIEVCELVASSGPAPAPGRLAPRWRRDPVTTRPDDRRSEPHAVLDRFLGDELRGVVGVLRSDDATRATALAEAAVGAGLACVEVTWTTPGASDVVRGLRERHPALLVGAGSVFTDDQATNARAAGAEFVVSPHLAESVSAACSAMGVLYVPGAATPTEVIRAMEMGHPMVKLFPIAQLGGPAFVKALRGPIPGLRAMVTGGVGADDVSAYLDAGAVLVGLGSVFAKDDAETRERVAAIYR